jgi:glycosyltransferase involved in cell wall biosynthesis
LGDITFFQNQEDLNLFLKSKLIKEKKARLVEGSGVDLNYFSPPCGESSRDSRSNCTFLVISRLLKEKGIYEFVEAVRAVKDQFPEAQFQLLGKRDERNPTVIPQKDIDLWQSEGLIDWLGETEDVRPFIAKADVVVLPSYREGLSRSLLEAAAMGKPLIATDVVGCREIVEHQVNGLLVPVKESKGLAEAMIWMILHPELREKMGQAGRIKVEQEFDERKVIEKILATYSF